MQRRMHSGSKVQGMDVLTIHSGLLPQACSAFPRGVSWSGQWLQGGSITIYSNFMLECCKFKLFMLESTFLFALLCFKFALGRRFASLSSHVQVKPTHSLHKLQQQTSNRGMHKYTLPCLTERWQLRCGGHRRCSRRAGWQPDSAEDTPVQVLLY